MECIQHFLWTGCELKDFFGQMSDKQEFVNGVTNAASVRLNEPIAANQCFEVKQFHCRASAGHMFGFSLSNGIQEIENNLQKVANVEDLRKGLIRVKSAVPVNHLLNVFPGEGCQLQHGLLSLCIMQRLSEIQGLEGTKLLCNSPLVELNASVKWFVFKWDIFAQLVAKKCIEATNKSSHTCRIFEMRTIVMMDSFVKNKGNCQNTSRD